MGVRAETEGDRFLPHREARRKVVACRSGWPALLLSRSGLREYRWGHLHHRPREDVLLAAGPRRAAGALLTPGERDPLGSGEVRRGVRLPEGQPAAEVRRCV